MLLIKRLGQRAVTSANGRTTKDQYGLFECPVCHTHVELTISKGNRNKSCGNKECRKAMFVPNPSNKGNTKEDAVTHKQYYATIKTNYQRLLKNNSITDKCSLEEFYNGVIERYEYKRTKRSTPAIILKLGATRLDPSTVDVLTGEELASYKLSEYAAVQLDKNEYDSLVLRSVCNVNKQVCDRVLTKLGVDITNTKIVITGGARSRESTAVVLTEDQYTKAKDVLLTNKKSESTYLYLIESCGYVKIGITHSIERRLSALEGSSPMTYTLLKSYKLENARKVEGLLHGKYRLKNHKREWFTLTADDIDEIDEFITNKRYKVTLSDTTI